MGGKLRLYESSATPATPAAGYGLYYLKADGHAYFINDAGTETLLTAGLTAIPVPVDEGGTGLASYTTGDMLYASGATTLAKLAIGAAGTFARSNGTAPTWSTATIPATATAGDLLYASANNVWSSLAKGTGRQLLQMNAGATAPEWTSNVDVPGTLDVTGNTVLDGTLNVVGAVDLDSTLNVDGTANIEGATTVDDTLTVTGTTTSAGVILSSGSLQFYEDASERVRSNYNTTGNHYRILTGDAAGSAFPTRLTIAGEQDDCEIAIGTTPQTGYALHVEGQGQIDGAWTFEEQAANPDDPTNNTHARLYLKGDKLIIQFNNAGTVRYKYLDLTGTGVTWTHTTVSP